ncbi:MAG: MutH/Sau3AI family endonuclease [Verrucomicrobiota bacterium]
MTRDEAIAKLAGLVGQDLRPLADTYRVTVWKNGKKNKGWAGDVVERFLGLPANPVQGPDFGDWELKVVPLRKVGGRWQPKETMAVTMIAADNVAATPFEHSHLLDKLRSLVICGRESVSEKDDHARFVKAAAFDLGDGALYRQVQDDYESLRALIRHGGLASVTGRIGLLVQARTKGPGHGSTTRAFYARTSLVARLLRLES